jgi:hypothetical protein
LTKGVIRLQVKRVMAAGVTSSLGVDGRLIDDPQGQEIRSTVHSMLPVGVRRSVSRQALGMNRALDDYLSGQPVATRQELLKLAPSHVIDHAIRRGELQRILPRTYMLTSALIGRPDGLLAAALRFAGGQGARPWCKVSPGQCTPSIPSVHQSV